MDVRRLALAGAALFLAPLAYAEGFMAEGVAADASDTFSPAELARSESQALPTWTPEPGDQIVFNVLRKGNPFGRHEVRFSETPDGDLLVDTEVRLKAGMGPITVFSYALDASETWSEGRLVALDGTLKSSGSEGRVTALVDDGQLSVDGTEFSGAVDLGILPSSHWNILQTQAEKLVSTEDGEIIDVTVTEQGVETIEAGGEMIDATRYLMDSDIDVDLWYDVEGRWVKLAFEARGQSIEYVLDRPY